MSVTYSTAELAERWGVNISKIGEWIRNGELRALNVAQTVKGHRPRYRITEEAVAAFEQARTVEAHAHA
jgi:excisionase family DNA binding protein